MLQQEKGAEKETIYRLFVLPIIHLGWHWKCAHTQPRPRLKTFQVTQKTATTWAGGLREERIAKAEISYFVPRTRNKTVVMVRHIAAMAAMAANSRGFVSLASAYLGTKHTR
ncbi:hypothetical protein ACSS6W_002438 [Trichoderma asperelloides]